MSSTLHPIHKTTGPPLLEGAVPNEVHELLTNAGFSDRQRTALSARLGLAGDGDRTLAEAGEAAGCTRERVRQLEARLRDYAAGSSFAFPGVRDAVRQVERLAPTSAVAAVSALAASRLVPAGFQLGGLLRVAEVLGVEHDLCQVNGAVLRTRDVRRLRELLRLARRVARRDGVGNVARLAHEIVDRAATVRRLLSLSAEVIWLDARRTWFLIRGMKSRAGGALRKMLSVSGTLTLRAVREGLARASRPVFVPVEVAAGLCSQYPWLVVDRARGVVTLKVTLDPNHTHSAVERTILGIFIEHGPVLTAKEVKDRGARLGLKRMSVGVYLTRMPALERLGPGRYALRGAVPA